MGVRADGDHRLFFSTLCYAALFMNPYIVAKAPAEIRRKWEMFSCPQPLPSADMKRTLEENGTTYTLEPDLPYRQYERQPNEEDEWVRFDITKGTTNCMPLIEQYYNGVQYLYDEFVSCGVAPMMLLVEQPDGMDTDKFIDYMGGVQDRIRDLFQQPGNIDGMILGSAYGRLGYGYIDLLVYDKKAFMNFLLNRPCLYTLLKPQKGIKKMTAFVQDFTHDDLLARLTLPH